MPIAEKALRFAVPAGSCDCHMHAYGPAERYPEAPTSRVPAPNAPIDAYRKTMAELGIERVVVVQPSTYGKDNRCTLDAMAALGSCARGVVVVDGDTTDLELARLTELGVRGVRFHMLAGGALPWPILEETAARVNAFGWHVQLQMDGRELSEREEILMRLPGTLVIDHVGKFLEPVPVEHPGFQTLLRLLDRGHVWVKLSAPYETSRVGPPSYADVGVLAKALVAQAPERLVWASNWPHPAVQNGSLDDAMLMETLLGWMKDDATRNRILVGNPVALYDFDE